MTKEFAEVAYTAYCEARGWHSYGGERLPAWDRVEPAIQDAWRDAADAVLEQAAAEREADAA